MLFYHVFCSGLAPDHAVGQRLMLFAPFNGTLAVFIFFLVSGFSLSTRYLTTGDKQKWLATVAGRYFRLAIPIFAACIVVHLGMVLGAIAAPDIRLEKFRSILHFSPTVGHLLNFTAFDVFFNYSPTNTYIGPLWTMSYELLGSYLVLISILIFRPFPYRLVLLLAVSTMMLVTINFKMLAIFPIGAAIADAYHRGWLERIPQWIAVTLMSTSLFVLPILPFGIVTWGILGAVPFVVGSIASPQARAFLSSPLSSKLGTISFPLYLIHGPVMLILGEPLTRDYGHSLIEKLAINTLVVVVSFGAALALMPFERGSIRFSRWFGRKVTRFIERLLWRATAGDQPSR